MQPVVAFSPPHASQHPYLLMKCLSVSHHHFCEQEGTLPVSRQNMLPPPTFGDRPLYMYDGRERKVPAKSTRGQPYLFLLPQFNLFNIFLMYALTHSLMYYGSKSYNTLS